MTFLVTTGDMEFSQMSDPLRVLAIHAHPDDVEIQCAGTLAILAEKGCHITIATMTAGDCGSAEHAPAEIARIRRAEARAAADLLGADYMCLEFMDLRVFFDDGSRRRVTEAFRKSRPDIVLTAPPVDYHSDHEVTSMLVRDACFCAPIPNYATQQWDPAPCTDRIPYLYYVDPVEGTDHYGRPLTPDFIVDVSRTFELKQKMLACHASQRAWLQRQHGMDEYLDASRRWSANRGAAINASFGEGFTQYRAHPYPHDNILLKILSR